MVGLSVAAWPAALPYQPPIDDLAHLMPEPRLRTETEAGPARVRRLSTVAITRVEMSLEFTRQQYELWRGWHRWSIRQGADWFDMPIFTAASYETLSVRLVKSPPAPRPAGNRWRLPFLVETYDMPVIELEDLDPVWPEGLPYEPVPDSLEPEDHAELLRGEGDEGPIDVRRRFVNTPGKQRLAWDLTLAQYATFRAWYRLALRDGVRWFELPVWTGDRYRDCQVRWAEPPEARLRGGRLWRVSGRLDLKLAATLDAAETLAALAAPGLHHLIHITMPAALPAGS